MKTLRWCSSWWRTGATSTEETTRAGLLCMLQPPAVSSRLLSECRPPSLCHITAEWCWGIRKHRRKSVLDNTHKTHTYSGFSQARDWPSGEGVDCTIGRHTFKANSRCYLTWIKMYFKLSEPVIFLLIEGQKLIGGCQENSFILHSGFTVAIWQMYLCFLRYLIEHSAHVGAVNSEGELPLDVATEDAMERLLKAEIKKQGKSNKNGRIGTSPLHLSGVLPLSDS